MSAPENKNKLGSHDDGSRNAAGSNAVDGNEAQPFPVTSPPATDNTHSSAPALVNPDAGTNLPASGPGAVSGGGGSSNPATHREQNASKSRTAKQIRPKEARGRARTKNRGLPQWRIEQLRRAGRAGLAKAIKNDPDHQRKSGKARATQTDMKVLGAEGNARSIELDPQHQARAGRGNQGKSKSKRKPSKKARSDSKAAPQAADPTDQKEGKHDDNNQRQ